MEIYRNFVKQTDAVVQYLSVARQYEHHTRVEVPKLKHAPVNLTRQLEDYLNDPDFEVHRRQYLAELEAKRSRSGSAPPKPFPTRAASTASKPASSSAFPNVATNTNGASSSNSKPTQAPDTDLIDFFDSIEPKPALQQAQVVGASPWDNATNFQPQVPNGFMPQQTGFQATNPFQQQMTGAFPQQQQQQPPPQLQPAYTGAGFGGFSAQPGFQSSLAPIPQDSVASFQAANTASMPNLQAPQQQPQITNPFRASMMMTGQPTGMTTQSAPGASAALQPQPTSTNPFARASPQPSSTPLQASPPPLQPMATGTNPFAKGFGAGATPQRPATSAGTLAPQPTGATNPFRQSQFVNHATGMGWQHNQQPIGGGLDSLQTVPVFPRPAQQTPWQQ